MVEKCDLCGKLFDKLSQLYMHKQSHTPSVLLHQHPHPAFGINTGEVTSKRKRDDDDESSIANKLQIVSQLSNESDFEPSSYSKMKKLKRKRSSDEDLLPAGKKISRKEKIDSDLKVIPYDRNEKKFRRGKLKKDKNKSRKFKEILDRDGKQFDFGLNISDDSKDEERDPSLGTLDKYDASYRKKYEINKLKNKFIDKIREQNENYEDEIEREKEKCRKTLVEVNKQFKAKLTDMKEECEEKVMKSEEKSKELMLQKDKVHKVEVDGITEKFEDEMKKKDKEFETMEKDFTRKIDMLHKHIQSEQEDEDYITPLAHAIFNCTTIEEIFEIKKLIETYRINELEDKHYKTLQNMFLSLSYGVLPICQPQRDTITDFQRELVGKIQNSSFLTAKEVLKENREEIANLFSIIEDSLNLARNSFNRYGNR